MFAYLSKKIAIPNGNKLKSTAWNKGDGWIGCGGENGLLRVLRLDAPHGPDSKGGANLSVNQTLDGHDGDVKVVRWNESGRKLTTSDQHGLIIVWTLHKDAWYEEMINNRNKSFVKDMRWTPAGDKICIVYEDGAVIVGGVDGNRLWGKELGISLALVEWSPDSRMILFSTANGQCHIYDWNGNFTSKIPFPATEGYAGTVQIVGVEWYDGSEGRFAQDCPVLAIGFHHGRIQLMMHESDENAIVVETGMELQKLNWNRDGSVLAVCGSQSTDVNGEQRTLSLVQFYNPFGRHMRTLRVPGGGITSLSWEGTGLRIALAVDSFIYFANVRPDYKWGYFSNTLVYAYTKKEREEHCVMFWDTKHDERYMKYVKRLLALKAHKEHCVLASKSENINEYILIICNEIGSPIESRYIEVPVQHLAITENHVIAASTDLVYMWHFRPAISSSVTGKTKEGQEKIFHIDQLPLAVGPDDWRAPMGTTSDPICAICANNEYLLVARSSGLVNRYALPHLALAGKHKLRSRPQRMEVNCDFTRMSIIDVNGVMSFFDFTAMNTSNIDLATTGEHLQYERKDVWDMKWSTDSPELFAIMEKSKIYILRGLDPEEPLVSSAYLCEFGDLEIKSVHLDEVMQTPDDPSSDLFVNFEARSLRDTRTLIESTSLEDAYAFVDQNPHPRMWRILAEHALGSQDFVMADKAFVRAGDYHGIQFVKNLQRLNDPIMQKAEVAFYFQKFNEAEELYLGMDRADLAIEMRSKLGDWFRVEKLVTEFGSDDTTLVTARNHIGEYYSDRHKWAKATQYYAQAKNSEKLVDCFYALEDFEGLEKLMKAIPEGTPILKDIGEKFQSVGLCEQGVAAFLKFGDSKRAVDCCVLLNQWNHAVELAAQENFVQIEQLLAKYANKLLEKDRVVEAVELYRKGNRHMEAANLLGSLAKQSADMKVYPVRVKKLHVLAALEIERFRKRALEQPEGLTTLVTGAAPAPTVQPTAAQTLAGLMTLDAASAQSDGQAFDNAWHSAEAYHFWLLSQQQLYSGNPEAAMRTALHLRHYEDVLDPEDIYALLAIASYSCKFFGQCSKAFIKLESLPGIPEPKRTQFADLALSIFLKNPPNDPKNIREAKIRKGSPHSILDGLGKAKEEVCVASGKSIRDSNFVRCRSCKHCSLVAELMDRYSCPLCHASLSDVRMDVSPPSVRHSQHGRWDLDAIVE